MTPVGEQLAAKLRLEELNRGDRVIITRPDHDPQIMLVNSRVRSGATIGEARITVRRPCARPAYAVTADMIASGVADVERACHACDNPADGTCIICEQPVCDEHAGSRAHDRWCQPPRAA